MKAFVVGDIHGCLNQLKELIENIDRETTRILLCGDLIDRGTHSKETIDFVRNNEIECTLGNHELMFIECRKYIEMLVNKEDVSYAMQYLHGSNWFLNGGKEVFNSYDGEYSLMLKDLDFLDTLPTYIKTGIKDKNNKELIVSHTLITLFMDEKGELNGAPTLNLVWSRELAPRYKINTPYFNIHGHTPVDYANQNKYQDMRKPTPEINLINNSVNLDTGCPYNTKTRGYLSGIFFPSLEVKQVKTFDRLPNETK